MLLGQGRFGESSGVRSLVPRSAVLEWMKLQGIWIVHLEVVVSTRRTDGVCDVFTSGIDRMCARSVAVNTMVQWPALVSGWVLGSAAAEESGVDACTCMRFDGSVEV